MIKKQQTFWVLLTHCFSFKLYSQVRVLYASAYKEWMDRWDNLTYSILSMETLTDFIFLGSKITATAVMKLKDALLLGRKPMTNLHSVFFNMLFSTDITLLIKVHIVKAMVFPGVMYRCESWTIKKGWVLKNWFFRTVVWRRLLRVPWTARRSNKSILKETNPEHSLEGLMLKLKLHYFGHMMWTASSLEKILMLGKVSGRRRRGWQSLRWLDGILTLRTWVWASSGSWWWSGKPGILQSMESQRVGHTE